MSHEEDIGVVTVDGSGDVPDTPQGSKLFTLVNDPRSPNNLSRTPIVVQNPVDDPRSPGFDSVERTPLYPVTDTAR